MATRPLLACFAEPPAGAVGVVFGHSDHFTAGLDRALELADQMAQNAPPSQVPRVLTHDDH